ncbi:MAG: circadian clock KaiB family protein [Candidatus Binatus sp.]|uniref:circadian clock KaiB family protein n=1 Tax=Candidatus Binatus sp. TaxID=2811406 RepID=UPI00271F76AE|nr:circadian clock KaiB family protein [Candidatus Binatus sp.]MDO8432045.1 circadian clock KaiB family protein [Candidatus Binatus sp.]
MAKPRLKKAAPRRDDYVLRLYTSGSTPRSARAIANLHKICEDRLKGHYQLDIIDLYQQPELAQSDDVIAVPTLVKELPPPKRKVVGDLSDEARVLIGLALTVHAAS